MPVTLVAVEEDVRVTTSATKVMMDPEALDEENMVENDSEMVVGASGADVSEATRTHDDEAGMGCADGVGWMLCCHVEVP